MSPRFPREDYRPLERYAPRPATDRAAPPEVDLSDNTNLWGPHPGALEAVRRTPESRLTRYPDVYAEDLRTAVAEAWGVPVECVVTGCGSDDLLDSAFRAACAAGCTVSFPVPTFSMAEVFARMNGLTPRPVPWEEGVARPGRLLEGDPGIVYLCSPNNPTGASIPPARIRELLEAAGSRGPVFVLDEAYADFGGPSLLADAPDLSRLLVLRTLSKAYGMAGLRVGIGVGAPELVREVEKSRGPYKVGAVAEAAAIAALRDEEGWVPFVVGEVRRVRKRLAAALVERGLRPLSSEANFLLVPVDRSATGLAGELRSRGVAVRPFPELPELGDAIRVTVGPWPLMERLLEALDRVRAT